MRVSGTEPSKVILSQKSSFKSLKVMCQNLLLVGNGSNKISKTEKLYKRAREANAYIGAGYCKQNQLKPIGMV